MAAFLRLEGIEGEVTDKGHEKWVIIESMSSSIFRTIPDGAKDQQRTKGETLLGDIIVSRQLDKSSVKIQEASANGTFFPEVYIHLCTTVLNRQEPYLIYKLSDVIVSSYLVHLTSSGDPIPMENLTFGFTEVEWTYITIDPKTGDKKGNVPGKYNPGKGAS